MTDALRDCCRIAEAQGLRELVAALAMDDLDAAIAQGLLEFQWHFQPGDACAKCDVAASLVGAAREARRSALTARERHRARIARLARRVEIRAARRAAAVLQSETQGTHIALPAAAAAALARAKAKAAGRT